MRAVEKLVGASSASIFLVEPDGSFARRRFTTGVTVTRTKAYPTRLPEGAVNHGPVCDVANSTVRMPAGKLCVPKFQPLVLFATSVFALSIPACFPSRCRAAAMAAKSANACASFFTM